MSENIDELTPTAAPEELTHDPAAQAAPEVAQATPTDDAHATDPAAAVETHEAPAVAADDAHEPGDSDESDDDGQDDEGAPRSSKRENLMNEGEIAADYLEELLDIADLDGDIDTFVESGRARVAIVNGPEVLVGRDGEVLDALQELCRLAIMTETGKRSRLMLDIAGHRDARRKELEAMAQDAVAEVKESGESVRLVAMNPYERKIVHDVVAAAGLASESEGVEPQRRVVVLPA